MGFTFDRGPSMVMMTECWHQLFRDVGRRLEDYLTLVRCDPTYRLHFADGATLEMTGQLDQLLANLERIEPGCAPRALRFLSHTGDTKGYWSSIATCTGLIDAQSRGHGPALRRLGAGGSAAHGGALFQG
jgi:phytoene dehydrogenase-like protein